LPEYKTIECPYCGNKLKIHLSSKSTFSFSIALPGGSGLGINFAGKGPNVLEYKIKCNFCGRTYKLFNFSDNYEYLLSFMSFTEEILQWIKRYKIDLDSIFNMIVGVTEPLYKPYQSFKQRLKRRFKEQDFKFIEVIFKIEYNGKEYRGVFAGKLYNTPHLTLEIQNAFWLNKPPIIEGED